METDGGGWTVIQRRKVGLTSFNRDWKQYREGFGNIRGDFWLGNENIYRLSRRPTVLRVELEVINKLLISAAKSFLIFQYQIPSPISIGGPKNLHALMTGEGSRINLGIHSNTRQEYVLPVQSQWNNLLSAHTWCLQNKWGSWKSCRSHCRQRSNYWSHLKIQKEMSHKVCKPLSLFILQHFLPAWVQEFVLYYPQFLQSVKGLSLT